MIYSFGLNKSNASVSVLSAVIRTSAVCTGGYGMNRIPDGHSDGSERCPASTDIVISLPANTFADIFAIPSLLTT